MNIKTLFDSINFDLLPKPISPGVYGTIVSTAYVTTNNRDELNKIKTKTGYGKSIIAIDAGGYDVKTASAYSCVKQEQFLKFVSSLTENTTQSVTLMISKVLADSMNLPEGDYSDLLRFTFGGVNEYIGNALFIRLLNGLKIWFLQTILISIPLILLGWLEFFITVTLVFINAILLSVIWPYLPNWSGGLKGLICGIALAIASAFVITKNIIPAEFWLIAIFSLLISVWIGLIMDGLKSG